MECARYENAKSIFAGDGETARYCISCALFAVSMAARAESDDFLAVVPIYDKVVIERSSVTLLLGNFLRFMGCLRDIRAARGAISNL